MAITISTWVDILGGNNLLLVVGLFTLKVFYALYIVPAYLFWLLLKKIWAFMGTDYSKTEEDYERERQMEKMKKKKQKKKVKYIK